MPSPARFYPVDRRPRVEVHHRDGTWYPGRLHAWLRRRRPPGWDAVVSYHVGAGLQYYLCVPAERVRPLVTTPRASP